MHNDSPFVLHLLPSLHVNIMCPRGKTTGNYKLKSTHAVLFSLKFFICMDYHCRSLRSSIAPGRFGFNYVGGSYEK